MFLQKNNIGSSKGKFTKYKNKQITDTSDDSDDSIDKKVPVL